LRYVNNISVTPGESLTVIVGAGGNGTNNTGFGGVGGVRVVWPGGTRSFPSTDVGSP
jgi:hypothetical protein